MVSAEDVRATADGAKAAFSDLLSAVPKARARNVIGPAMYIEANLNVGFNCALLLVAMRGYFLQTTGEASPFVQRINDLLGSMEGAAPPPAQEGGK